MGRGDGGRRGRLILGAGVVVALIGVAMVLAPAAYEVVDKGRDLRPYESGPIYKIRVADSFTVYAAAESRPEPDVISGSLLVAMATVALMAGLLLRAIDGPPRLRTFYEIAAGGFGLLAADEFFAFHGTIGHNLLFITDLPGIERPDDLIFALYVVPALIFAYVFRDILLGSSRAVRLFTAGIGVFGLAAISDVAGVSLDEPLEVLSGALIASGFVVLVTAHLSGALAAWGARDAEAPSGEAATEMAQTSAGS